MEGMISAKDMKKEEEFKAIIYGIAGSGKTHLMKYMPRPLVILDLDNKVHPLMGEDDIYVLPFHLKDANEARAMIPKVWRAVKDLQKEEDIKTIVLDSITALDRMVFRWAMLSAGKKADDKGTLPIFGDMKRWYTTFFPMLNNINKNVVLLAHEQHKEDDGTLLSIRPYVTGSIGDELSSIFPNTFNLEYIGGAKERWRLYYRKRQKYVSSSSIISEGVGYVEYGRNEDGLQAILKMVK